MTDATASAVQPEGKAAKSTKDIFKYSDYVHAGPGAEECEDALNGACGDPLHFHALCRLPNQLQHQDIREKALAAKARRIRMLRDDDADAHDVLEGDLYEIERTGDTAAVVEELVQKNWWRDHMDAMRDTQAEDEFALIDKDRERFAEIERMPEDRRPKDETAEIAKHIAAYGDAVEARRHEIQKPQREALASKPMGELITILRDDRVNAEASATFMQTYNLWEWFIGTYRVPEATPEQVEQIKLGQQGPQAKKRFFASVDEMTEAEPDVIEAIAATFTELERALQDVGGPGKASS
jgi:hypothetical protein